MLDLYESIREDPSFNKLEIGDVLFAEYTCPIGEEKLGLYAPMDYMIHVISGKKTWHTSDGSWTAESGETIFFRKSAAIVEQSFEVGFCLFMFFFPDRLMRETVKEMLGRLGPASTNVGRIKTATRVENDTALNAFFRSMKTYFSGDEKPPEALLELKLKELIVGILTGTGNPGLASYFRSLQQSDAPSIEQIMEENFRFNLSLEEYARLCHRSLSSFKRDFRKEFDETPGKWLLAKRLDHAAALLRNSSQNVTEIVFDSGFEDVSHFSRVFKERFQMSPSTFRESASTPV
jgi:AraC-like DNA-binding protein